MSVKYWMVIGLSLTGLAVGCGGGTPAVKTVPVSGTITYKGKPIEGATVSFMAEGAPRAASGVTDANGEFKLSMFKFNDGALVGENKVVVVKANPEATPKSAATPEQMLADPSILAKQSAAASSKKNVPASLIPEKYASPRSTPLKETVTEAGPNSFVIQLTD